MNLTDHLLISTGNLRNSIFQNGVVYICRHDDEGAFGVVINKPSDISVANLLEKLKIDAPEIDANMVLQGGPVKPEQVFILHSPPDDFDVTIKSGKDIGITLSQDILTAISENRAPEKILFAFGYAGWEKGQLENEIKSNAWITLPATADIIFDTPFNTRFAKAGEMLGFDINNLSIMSGNA